MSQGVQERQQVMGQQSYISISSSTSPDMTTVFHAWLFDRFIEIQSNLSRKKLQRTKQSSSLKNHAENEVGRLALDLFPFFKKA